MAPFSFSGFRGSPSGRNVRVRLLSFFVMLAIALVADAVLCVVFALTVHVGGPRVVRSEVDWLRATIESQCEDEGMVRAQVYELFLERQTRAIAVDEQTIAGPIASEWQPVRRGWFAVQLGDDEAAETEMRIGLSHLAWCEDRRSELGRLLAGTEQP